MEAQEASDFLKSPLGARLKHAMLKIVRRKILEEKDKKLRSDMVRMIDHPAKQDHTVGTLTADNDGTFSPDLEQKIKEELEDRDSISSAVFESMMRNDTIRKDMLRELQHAVQLTPGEEGAGTPEDEFNGTQYSGNTFIYREGHSALSSTVLARNDAKIPSQKMTSSQEEGVTLPPDLTSMNSKMEANSQTFNQRPLNQSEGNNPQGG